MFPCTTVFDCELDQIVNYWYSDTLTLAREKESAFRTRYPDTARYEITTEYVGGSYNLDNACGY